MQRLSPLRCMRTRVACWSMVPAAAAQQAPADPFRWLEEVEGKKALEWVEARNAMTVAALGKTPLYQSLFERTKRILDSKDRIAFPSIKGEMLYNF